jgi:nitrogen regulatory protein P-II 1
MMKIEAVIQPFKLEEIAATLEDLGIEGITIFQVLNHGGPTEYKTFYRGAECHVDGPRLKLEMLTSSDRADEVIDAILAVARASKSRDGTVLMYEVADAVQIRTGARLQYTLS